MEKLFKLPRKWAEEVWFPALLSGKYKQGSGQLYDPNEVDEHGYTINEPEPTYCCLGVAAIACGVPLNVLGDLAYVETDAELTLYATSSSRGKRLTEVALKFSYPRELMYERAKIKTPTVTHAKETNKTLAETVAEMNDAKIPFEGIVEWVKQNVDLYE